jgi:hypothetical protein
MQIVIAADGSARSLYSETIDLASLGSLKIARGSYVEPDAKGHWWADLAPVKGPKLGPFLLRSEALAAESVWLESHWLARPRLQ